MKKFDFDKKLLQIAILAFLVIIGSITFSQTIDNLGDVVNNLAHTFRYIKNILQPFLVGFCIAFVLNPAVRKIESSSIKNINFLQKNKRLRMLAIFITYICTFLCIFLLISILLPNVLSSLIILADSLPTNIINFRNFLNEYIEREATSIALVIDYLSSITGDNYDITEIIGATLKSISETAKNIPDILTTLLKSTINIANIILSLALGFVISIYYLADKEYFLSQTKKFIYVIVNKKTAEKIFRISSLSSMTLEKFIVGKAIDSAIIGFLFFVICSFLNIPYTPLFALIIGVTNMIPYFGPFIGAVPVLLIACIYDFSTFIPLSMLILALQQFDGVILGPKILGESIGLKPISIILAIMIGGGLFGAIGMFLGAPIYAVIATIVGELVNKSYDKVTR